jgi:hypothetical protein
MRQRPGKALKRLRSGSGGSRGGSVLAASRLPRQVVSERAVQLGHGVTVDRMERSGKVTQLLLGRRDGTQGRARIGDVCELPSQLAERAIQLTHCRRVLLAMLQPQAQLCLELGQSLYRRMPDLLGVGGSLSRDRMMGGAGIGPKRQPTGKEKHSNEAGSAITPSKESTAAAAERKAADVLRSVPALGLGHRAAHVTQLHSSGQPIVEPKVEISGPRRLRFVWPPSNAPRTTGHQADGKDPKGKRASEAETEDVRRQQNAGPHHRTENQTGDRATKHSRQADGSNGRTQRA